MDGGTHRLGGHRVRPGAGVPRHARHRCLRPGGDQTQRDNGYLTSGRSQFTTAGVAITSDNIELYDVGTDSLGKVLIRATSSDSGRPLFLGIGPTSQVNAYLANVPYSTVNDFSNGNSRGHQPSQATVAPGRSPRLR